MADEGAEAVWPPPAVLGDLKVCLCGAIFNLDEDGAGVGRANPAHKFVLADVDKNLGDALIDRDLYNDLAEALLTEGFEQ